MTLLVNEIHVAADLNRTLIVQAADRRITVKGKFHSNCRKLFKIPYLRAAVGYFGLAQVNRTELFSSWLPNFINRASDAPTLEVFAKRLHEQLNRSVDKRFLARNASGLHVCGYGACSYPELWFIRNISGMERHHYKRFEPDYEISEDFLARDARNVGFDGLDPHVSTSFRQYYVNGDIRAFHAAWRRLDDLLEQMFAQPDFESPKCPDDLVQIAEWKMKVIASFYNEFASKKIIGTPIDALVLVPPGAAS